MEIIKSIRLLKTLSKIILTKNQIELLSLDNSHLISSYDPSSGRNIGHKIGITNSTNVTAIKSEFESNILSIISKYIKSPFKA